MRGRVVRLTIRPVGGNGMEVMEKRLTTSSDFTGVLNTYALGDSGIYEVVLSPGITLRIHPDLQDIRFEVIW